MLKQPSTIDQAVASNRLIFGEEHSEFIMPAIGAWKAGYDREDTPKVWQFKPSAAHSVETYDGSLADALQNEPWHIRPLVFVYEVDTNRMTISKSVISSVSFFQNPKYQYPPEGCGVLVQVAGALEEGDVYTAYNLNARTPVYRRTFFSFEQAKKDLLSRLKVRAQATSDIAAYVQNMSEYELKNQTVFPEE